MSANEIQKLINNLYYWDARVIALNCSCFADEIELIYEDEEFDVVYKFSGCYNSCFNHVKSYDKSGVVEKMKKSQLPYFLQDVEISEAMESENNFYVCKIKMFPLNLEIWCKDIQVIQKQKSKKS